MNGNKTADKQKYNMERFEHDVKSGGNLLAVKRFLGMEKKSDVCT